MGFSCGIVGLPNVGKSTLFNALTAGHADASNYPFCTITPNIGIVPVPDRRLALVGAAYRSRLLVPTTLGFHDIAGLVRGASRGEGLGNQFLAHIREVDALAHVVRCFDDPNVTHVNGAVDPRSDIGVVGTELILKDLDTVERRHADTVRRGKGGEKKPADEAAFLLRLRNHLLADRPARSFSIHTEAESALIRELHLLTLKPVLYICNVSEQPAGAEMERVATVTRIATDEGAGVVTMSAAMEAEIAELPADEQAEFLAGLGMDESGLSRMIREGYQLLHLLTFFTANEKEARAWTVKRGTRAPEAAGAIHSDFQQGFIRAEIIKFADLGRLGSETAVREAGLLALQGKEYVVEDGDIMYFRFHV